ncbi:DNA-binding MarR family transcriptional regulator [Labrenzia sp. EL_208]|nr:DNA-binding MarR family transcriptional regulator [Labrenzia sp. EL_132]MBG6233237.1 DNA-binding MarR family transcriptional regulator [Labrenzia sp. EL_208]
MKKNELLHHILWLSRPLMQRTEQLVRDGLGETALTVRMRAVLEVLATSGPLSVPDIGRELQIQRQYAQVMVNEVLSEGLAERLPNPKHRSSVLIKLSQEGKATIDGVLARELEVAEQLSKAFSLRDLQTVQVVMTQLIDKLGQNNQTKG